MRAAELESLLVEMLVGATGGKYAKWVRAVGAIEVLPISMNPRSNWRVIPVGTAAEKDAVQRAAGIVRGEHPYAEP